MPHTRGGNVAAGITDAGEEPPPALSSFVTLFFPFAEFDVEYLVITYWWFVLIIFVACMGACEYARLHWQVWCDRRRLESHREQCKVRKTVHEMLSKQGRAPPTTAPNPPDVSATGEKAATQTPMKTETMGRRSREAATAQGRHTPIAGHLANAASAADGNDKGIATSAGGGVVPEPAIDLPVFSPLFHDHVARCQDDSGPAGTMTRRGAPAARKPSSTSTKESDRTSPDSAVSAAAEEEEETSFGELDSKNSSVSKRIAASLQSTALLGRFGAPTTTPVSPGGLTTDGESSAYNESLPLSTSFAMATYCCPRYSEDEQQKMKRRRQENKKDWLEARRALKNTTAMLPGPESTAPELTRPPEEPSREGLSSSSTVRRRLRKTEERV